MKKYYFLNTLVSCKALYVDTVTLTVENILGDLPMYPDSHVEFNNEDELEEYIGVLLKTGWFFGGNAEEPDIEEVIEG